MKTDFLKIIFYKRASAYLANEGNIGFVNKTFDELHTAYKSKKRQYHDINHIVALIQHLETFKFQVNDYDVVFFSIWFHDSVYVAGKTDNELRSADWAEDFLKKIGFPAERIAKVRHFILSTASHISTGENDLNYFLDFDLSVLGADDAVYDIYSRQIRDEFSFFASFLYNSGRKKVLKGLLEKETIYQTEDFKGRLEIQARKNIKREIESL